MIILGTANLGTSYGLFNHHISDPIYFLKSAFENGITMLDTSNGYLNSYEFIANSGIAWELNAKIRLHSSNKDFFSVSQIEIEKTLHLIPKSKIKRLLIHDFRDLVKFKENEVSEGLSRLKSMFDIEMVGISAYPEQVESLYSYGLDTIQVPFNVLDQRMCHLSSSDHESPFKFRLQARSIYLQGLLTRNYSNVQNGKFTCLELEKFHEWCAVKKMDPSLVSSYFVVQSGLFPDIVIGASSIDELQSNLNNLRSAQNSFIEFPYEDFNCTNLNIIDPRLWH